MKNIILIGMPGCGKSTVGVILAKSLGYSFTDTDLLISQKACKPLQKIIDNNGLEAFLKIEEEVGATLDCYGYVVATGGSMVLSEKAMKNLKKLGTVIYINVALSEIEKRLVDFKTRGIVRKKGESIEDIFNSRCELYEKYADIIVESENDAILEHTVHKIVEAIDNSNIEI